MYFTICIPVYDRRATVLRTLESVRAQSFQDLEVLIVDDGSTDGSGDVCEAYIKENGLDDRFRVFRKPNGGKHSALNAGIGLARGAFFIILDSDDWLTDGALEKLHGLCEQIAEDDSFCGVMGKSLDSSTGRMIGDPFDLSRPVSSYFEYHFVMTQKMHVRDSFEAVKTALLKPFRFPEQPGMRFVPEAWLFDQLGIKYKLLLTNEIFQEKEYLQDGMTLDPDFKRRNACGFLYHYISRIENVVSKADVPASLRFRLLVLSWWRYWQCVDMDAEGKGPRVGRVTPLGRLVRLGSPVIEAVFRRRYGGA